MNISQWQCVLLHWAIAPIGLISGYRASIGTDAINSKVGAQTMTAAQHFDLFQAGTPARTLSVPSRPWAPILPREASPQPRPITLVLDSVMFTGRVPLSTWTFTIAIADKLWVSDRTTLYFGKETRINRLIYHDTIPLQGHRVNLDVGVAVYNNYGDVMRILQPVRFYELGSEVQPSALLHVEHNWMQLMFKFRLMVHEAETV